MRIKLGFILCVAIALTVAPSSLFAQEIPASVKKKVVADFRPKLSEFMPFGTSQTCSLKPKGDANCDDLVNQFDLSLWEVEFNTTNNPRRSDFNNDGVVNLLDYGLWKNTFYPSKPTALSSFIQKIANLLHISVTAQENQPATGGLTESQAVLGASGDGFVVNQNQNNTTQQVAFNSDANPTDSQIFGENGQFLTGIAFLNTGTTVVTTEEDGVQVQITRTAEGPVFQFFRNADGTLIASKSWPTAATYDEGQPPISVNLPGAKPGEVISLNIQPNGGGTMTEIDRNGEITRQTQISSNGLETRYDVASNSTLQTLDQYGITILSMPNNIGGKTAYYFSENELFNIIQTDDKSNTWFANLTADNQWEIFNVREVQEAKRIVDDPIKAVNSNTPSPDQLIQTWNAVLAIAKTDPPDIDFATGFNSNSNLLASQVTEADYAYKVNRVPPPTNVLGIIKDARAQQPPPTSNPWKNDDRANEAFGAPPANDSRLTTDSGYKATTSAGGTFGNGSEAIAAVRVDFYAPGATTPTNSVEFVGTPADFARAGITVGPNGGVGVGLTPDNLSALTAGAPGITAHTPRNDPLSERPGSTPTVSLPTDLPTATNPTRTDPTRTDPTRTDPARTDPTRTDPTRTDPARTTPGGGYTPPGWTPTNPRNPTAQRNDPVDYAGFNSFSHLTVLGNGNTVVTTTYRNGFQQSEFTPAGVPVATTFTTTTGALSGSVMNIDPATQQVTSINNVPGVEGGRVDLSNSNLGNKVEGLDASQIAAINTQLREQAEANGQPEFNGLNSDGTVTKSPTANGNRADSCFLAGTLISTPEGSIPIETLKPGDKVYSYNEKTRKRQVSDFQELDINFVNEYLIINKKIHTTVYHPFYKIVNKELITVRADALKLGDTLQTEEGQFISVDSIEKIPAPKTTVYNLTNVSPNNNFFAEGILVHNYGGEDFSDPASQNLSTDISFDPGSNEQGSSDQNTPAGDGGTGEANN